MKKKKGFTLIELLAVIVVLAIIALIATPIVMNTIEKSKKGAAERSADNYIDAVETTVATKRLDGDILEGTYTINNKGNLTGNGLTEPLVIEMNGNKPTSGTITISNGQVTTDTTMTIGDYDVAYNPTNKKYEATKKNTPSVEVLCKAVTTATTGNVPSGSFNYGDEYTCELGDNDTKTFFVLETNGDNVSLLMNANVDSNGKAITPNNIPDNIPDDYGEVAWISEEDWQKAGGVLTDDIKSQPACNFAKLCFTTEYGPLTAKAYLSSSTVSWTKLTESQISLPSYDQIYKAAGNKTSELPTWLHDYLYSMPNAVSIAFGYWTSTIAHETEAYAVYYDDIDTSGLDLGAGFGGRYGVRPVITISKSNLK